MPSPRGTPIPFPISPVTDAEIGRLIDLIRASRREEAKLIIADMLRRLSIAREWPPS